MSYQRLYEISDDLINLSSDLTFTRSEIFGALEPSTQVATVLKGARGIGKSTVVLQFLADKKKKGHKAFYFSADSALLNQTLAELALEYSRRGGQYLAIDEIHYIENWQGQVKTILDAFPSLKVIVSGSSSLSLATQGADLSRRHSVIHARGLSFREYIDKNYGITLSIYKLDELLNNVESIVSDILRLFKARGLDILDIFSDFLKTGYFLSKSNFDRDNQYYASLIQTMNSIIDIDVPSAHQDVDSMGRNNIKKLLKHIALKCPFTPNISELGRNLSISNDNVLKKYLLYLCESEILNNIYCSNKSHKDFQKPEKILLNNTNYCYAFETQPLLGTIRETYAASVLSYLGELTAPTHGDFCLNQKWIFEVGGPSKNKKQIRFQDHSYVLADQFLSADKNKIPLWILGFFW